MFAPIRTDSPLRATPWMNWALITANILIFALQIIDPTISQTYVLNPQNPHLLNYFTYAFLHETSMHLGNTGIILPLHLGFNMLFLYIFGNNINDKMGNIAYLAFYLAGAVIAGIGYVLTGSAPVLGASGAVSAVTGAYLVLFPRSTITIIYFFWIVGTFEIPSVWFIIFFFVQDIVLNFYGAQSVAHSAHISGSLFGFFLCFLLLAIKLLPRDQFDIMAVFQRYHRRRTYRNLVAAGYDPFAYPTSSPDAQSKRPDPNQGAILSLRSDIAAALSRHDLAGATQLFGRLKQIDPRQVLWRQAQIDIANQLASEQHYLEAADAYEQIIRHFPGYERIMDVNLMLGLIYARYLHQYPQARDCLIRALQGLHGQREIDLARGELERIKPLLEQPGGQ